MENLNITLEFTKGHDENGKEIVEKKTFVASHVKARKVRDAIKMANNINTEDMKPEDLDNMVNYVVELFGNQFTIDNFYDGVDSDKMIDTIMDCINKVIGKMGAKLQQFPNTQTGK